MKKIDFSIIVPVLNEKESLNELISGIDKALGKISHEYIFIDDGSTDRSFETLMHLKKHSKVPMTIIQFRKNLGKSAALAVGFTKTMGEYIVTIDADLQDDPDEILHLFAKLKTGFDMVVGWRTKRADDGGKIRLSHIFNSIVSKVSGVPLHDMNCGLKVMRQTVAKEINLYGELHRYVPVLAAARGFRVTELSVVHHQRKFGSSKFGTNRIVHAAFDLITTVFLISFRNKPLQIFGPIGIGFILCGILPLTYLTHLHFIGISIGRRPLLQLGILFLLFGVQIFSTGLIGELITSSQDGKNRYPIEKIIE
jgi:glycosyltransferase involved in cell wall biosynthesis